MSSLSSSFLIDYDNDIQMSQTSIREIIESFANLNESEFQVIDKGKSKVGYEIDLCYCIVSINGRLFEFTWYEKKKPVIDIVFDPFEIDRDILQPNDYYRLKPPERMISPEGFLRIFDNGEKFLDFELTDVIHGGNGFNIIETTRDESRNGNFDIVTVIFEVGGRFFRIRWQQFIDDDGRAINDFSTAQPVEMERYIKPKAAYKEKEK